MVGLAHNAFYRVKKAIPGTNAPVWEVLEALRRPPDYTVAYPEWIPDLHNLPVFERKTAFELPRRLVVANAAKVVWAMRWDRIAPSAWPLSGAGSGGEHPKLLDALDVAHLADERVHDYALLSDDKPSGALRTAPRGEKTLVDGGRMVAAGDGERFVMRARVGRPATLTMRTFGPGRLDVEVKVGGKPAGRLTAALEPGLNEVTHAIPAGLVRDTELRFELRARAPYGSFHYWLW